MSALNFMILGFMESMLTVLCLGAFLFVLSVAYMTEER